MDAQWICELLPGRDSYTRNFRMERLLSSTFFSGSSCGDYLVRMVTTISRVTCVIGTCQKPFPHDGDSSCSLKNRTVLMFATSNTTLRWFIHVIATFNLSSSSFLAENEGHTGLEMSQHPFETLSAISIGCVVMCRSPRWRSVCFPQTLLLVYQINL